MYSIYGDTVLDPFWGTGTTSVAAMVAGRNSVGYDLQEEFTEVFGDRVDEVDMLSRKILHERIDRHRDFAESRQDDGDPLGYATTNYDFPVMTKQEQNIRFYIVENVERADETYILTHSEFGGSGEFELPETEDRSTLGGDCS
jgi:hypothetical protein